MGKKLGRDRAMSADTNWPYSMPCNTMLCNKKKNTPVTNLTGEIALNLCNSLLLFGSGGLNKRVMAPPYVKGSHLVQIWPLISNCSAEVAFVSRKSHSGKEIWSTFS